MANEKAQKKKREPDSERLKIVGDWERAVAKALTTPKPNSGVGRLEKGKTGS